jgi:hypothetical protein
MKEDSLNSSKIAQKSSLHMKRKKGLSKNEKFFDFLKMDKNKCPKSGSQNSPY